MALTSNSSSIANNVNKRFKSSSTIDVNILQKISNQIVELQTTFTSKICTLENKLDLLVTCYSEIIERLESDRFLYNSENGDIKYSLIKSNISTDEENRHKCCKETIDRLSSIENMVKNVIDLSHSSEPMQIDKKSEDGVTVLLPQIKPKVEAQIGLDASIQVITLNSESDFPDGSWLGDENNVEARVRVPITTAQLLHINNYCTTPGKMAIVLVDYLFPKEVLAMSNLSGKGKHLKKQLDPLMIYGIRAHLLHKFKITEKDWYRIKQNIDSKCRTAWRKKVRGVHLGENKNPIHNRSDSNEPQNVTMKPYILSTNSLSSEEVAEDSDSGVIRVNKGNFKIVCATREQVAKLQESHNVKVFTNEDVAEMFPPSQMFSVEDIDSYTLTGCSDEQTLTIITENGEVNIPLSSDDSLGGDQFITPDPLEAGDNDEPDEDSHHSEK